MLSSKIEDLLYRLMDTPVIGDIVSNDYDRHMDSARQLHAFKEPRVNIIAWIDDDTAFYANIEELCAEAETIKKYALGIENTDGNIIRYDNADHHKKLSNPPHHKHIGIDEKVYDFDGTIDTMIKELSEYFKK